MLRGSQTLRDVGKAIDNLLLLGAIRPCIQSDRQFISSYFLIKKSDGSFRFVLNLKKLNEYMLTKHFKLKDGRTAEKLLSRGDYLANLDLQNAYYLIPISESSSRYLRFIFEGQCFEFTCLPFGLTVAPHVFTKVLRPVVNHLRKEGFTSVVYLDDFLIIAPCRQACIENVRTTIELLENLGFIINYKKSNLEPSLKTEVLGIIFNSRKMRLELPERKKRKMLKLLNKFRPGKVCSLRKWSSFVGAINACSPALKYSRLYIKGFERVRYLGLLENNNNYEAKICIPKKLELDFDWWKKNIPRSSNPIRQGKYTCEIFSDASTTGWGVFCDGNRARGFWTEKERKWHINRLELQAALIALKRLAKNIKNCEILLRLDNTTAISYVNKMGGVQHPNLQKIAKEIWRWCEARNIWLVASYIKSEDNTEADRESRVKNRHGVGASRLCLSGSHNSVWISKRRLIFATRHNTKCKKFFAWDNDPEALAIDAFTMEWQSLGLFWAFRTVTKSAKKDYNRPGHRNSGPILDGPTLVPLIYETFNRKAVSLQAFSYSTFVSLQVSPPVSRGVVPDSQQIIREAFIRKGMPSSSLDILEASLANSTHKQYAGPLKQWWLHCAEENLDPYHPEESRVIDFSSKKFKEGASYSTLNTLRSAISLISADNISQNRNISRFFKGIFMLRPAKPKYDRTWDVNVVFEKNKDWFPLEKLSLETLTERLVLLLALGTAHRIQTLASIKITNIKRRPEGYEIEIPDRIKTSRPGASQPLLLVPTFPENPRLCIATSLDVYIKATAQLRGKIDNLIVTTKKPIKAAAPATISRWIRAAMSKCGISKGFTAHSTKHAATSAAMKKGISIETIKKTAGWSKNSRVFEKYYNKSIISTKNSFTDSLMR